MRALGNLIPAILFLSLFASAQSQLGEKEEQIDKLFAPWSKPDVPGAAVVVVMDGKPVLVKGYGCADLEHGDPVTPKTLFNAASLAKQFSAFAVLTLVGQKKLSLDERIRNWFSAVVAEQALGCRFFPPTIVGKHKPRLKKMSGTA